jgi:luciferase family oxidoreductase group 1
MGAVSPAKISLDATLHTRAARDTEFFVADAGGHLRDRLLAAPRSIPPPIGADHGWPGFDAGFRPIRSGAGLRPELLWIAIGLHRIFSRCFDVTSPKGQNMERRMIPYSVLDLSPIVQGSSARDAYRNTLDLARHAERWGYRRYWLAEHHNMTGIASAATSVLIGHVAGGTSTIRVGAGGIMLPNHAPLVIAEQFGTLATLYPDRIDLGLGRAPGTDMSTARALRRTLDDGEGFPQDVLELIGYFEDEQPGQAVRAVPGVGTRVPVWILGSSLYGAQLAAHLGLPYAFASHFAPGALDQAVAVYRQTFRPSGHLAKPYFMLALNVFAGSSDAEGIYLKSSMQQSFANLRAGRPGPLPRPVEDIAAHLDPPLMSMVDRALACSAHGSPDTVRGQLVKFISRYQPDEVILNGHIHDHDARLRSFEIAADIMKSLKPAGSGAGWT